MVVCLSTEVSKLNQGDQCRAGQAALEDVLMLHHGLALEQYLRCGLHFFGSKVGPWFAAHQDAAVGKDLLELGVLCLAGC